MERVVFFGSPAFALTSLDALLASEFAPLLVITQPDRPAGRGRKSTPTAVRAHAEARGLPVRILEGFGKGGMLESLRACAPDFFVVVSFGRIFPPEALAIPRIACVNLHASLLPAYRGASPINAAIVRGDSVTGVTTMEMTTELDAGPLYLQESIAIDLNENAGELAERLARRGAPLLLETLRRISRDGLRPSPQPSTGVSTAPLLHKRDGLIPWERDAVAVHNHVRGMNPWPGSHTYHRDAYLKVHRASVADRESRRGRPGEILEASGDAIVAACGRGSLRLIELQAEGKKSHEAAAFLRGFALEKGEVFGGRAQR
jgi:methionyl-tRNA formyltransferase